MAGFDHTFQRQLGVQSWTLYGVAMSFLLLRLAGRANRVGVRCLLMDDWLMMLAGAWYTVLIISLNVTASNGGSNLFPPNELESFSDADIEERIKGSKIVVLSEQAMLNVIYTLKACMLFMYFRLTSGHSHLSKVKALAVYVALGYFGTQLAFFLTCRPFSGYWAVPPPNPQCTTLEHYAYVQASFNISSDLLMLFIPMPILIHLRLPLKRKIVLGLIFSMGIFVIVAAILTKVYNLSDVYSPTYMLWYVREASVAVLVANLPILWTILRDAFPALRSLSVATSPSSSAATTPPSQLPSPRGIGAHPMSRLAPPQTASSIYARHVSVAGSKRGSRFAEDEDEEEGGSFDGLAEKARNGSAASDERELCAAAAAWREMGKGEITTAVTISITREDIEGAWDQREEAKPESDDESKFTAE